MDTLIDEGTNLVTGFICFIVILYALVYVMAGISRVINWIVERFKL